mgnify:CR=1 FL=1
MSKHVSASDLRTNLARYLDEVEADRTEIVVTRQNHEDVVIMTRADWESLNETLHLLSTPANARALRESIAELDAGHGFEHALTEE